MWLRVCRVSGLTVPSSERVQNNFISSKTRFGIETFVVQAAGLSEELRRGCFEPGKQYMATSSSR